LSNTNFTATGNEDRCPGRVNSSCSTSGTRRVTLVAKYVIWQSFLFHLLKIIWQYKWCIYNRIEILYNRIIYTRVKHGDWPWSIWLLPQCVLLLIIIRDRRVLDRMVGGFTTTYAISAYHHWCCGFESRSRRGIQHHVIKFVSYLRQVGGFHPVSSTNKTDRHDITEILLKVSLNTIKQTNIYY
jgi:hypothetical protein